jgi:aminoglycoside phosphotransferase (APT) family kinase protein
VGSTSAEGVLDLTGLEAWLRAQGVAPVGPLSASQIHGGRSNLTFFIADARGRRWVLRRPPLGHVMATAHDVAREVKILGALRGVIPVPAVIGLDADVSGVPFYVMEEVPGRVIRTASDVESLPRAARAECGRSMIRHLAALHAIVPESVGLGDFGRGTDYLPRQIALWQRMGDQYRTGPYPEADAARDRLLHAAPPQEHVTLVHGDYRLDNILVDGAGSLQAILDWELCTRGDPFVDLAVCLFYWTDPDDALHPFADPATVLPGFLTREELSREYVRAGGRALPRPDYYMGYAAWRLALVFEGVLGRFRAGAYGESDHAEENRLAGVIKRLIETSHDLLDRDEARGAR